MKHINPITACLAISTSLMFSCSSFATTAATISFVDSSNNAVSSTVIDNLRIQPANSDSGYPFDEECISNNEVTFDNSYSSIGCKYSTLSTYYDFGCLERGEGNETIVPFEDISNLTTTNGNIDNQAVVVPSSCN